MILLPDDITYVYLSGSAERERENSCVITITKKSKIVFKLPTNSPISVISYLNLTVISLFVSGLFYCTYTI